MATDLTNVIKDFVYGVIGLIIGVSLVPVVASAVSQAQENVSGASGVMLGLLTLLFVVGVLSYGVKTLLK